METHKLAKAVKEHFERAFDEGIAARGQLDDSEQQLLQMANEILNGGSPSSITPTKDIVQLASDIAHVAHAKQVRKITNEPYINHPKRVVATVFSRKAKAAAWLHDVLEDTEVTGVELRQAGIPRDVVEVVALLTRPKDQTYYDFIHKIIASKNKLAIEVKLADLADNMRDAKEGSLKDKYRFAYQLLLQCWSGASFDRD